MNRLHEIAQLVVASWRIAADENESLIPTSDGILDRALEAVASERVLPEWAIDEIHFVDSRIGRQCVELPMILEWAQTAELTSAPNPSYQVAQVQITERTAKKLLWRLGMSEEEAKRIGTVLHDALHRLTENMEPEPFAI